MSAPTTLDPDVVAADVAGAVGLAEGPAGVRAVLREIARGAGSTRAVGRATALPLPVVAAICGELRTRGVLTADRPARLTAAGRAAFDPGADVTGRCPTCAGRGVLAPEDLAAALAEPAAAAPPVRVELDQTHCTPETKARRVLAMHDAGALAGRRVLVLGDDDLVSLALAEFARRHGSGPASVTVVELDPAIVEFLRSRLADAPFPVEVVEHDLAVPLPDRLLSTMDTVQTDPPYTVAGAELFLTRAASALRPGAGAEVFLSLGVRRPAETVAAAAGAEPARAGGAGDGARLQRVRRGRRARRHQRALASGERRGAFGRAGRGLQRRGPQPPPVRLHRVRHRPDRRRGPALAHGRGAEGGRLPALRRPHVPAAHHQGARRAR